MQTFHQMKYDTTGNVITFLFKNIFFHRNDFSLNGILLKLSNNDNIMKPWLTSSHLMDNFCPCFYLNHKNLPRYGFSSLGLLFNLILLFNILNNNICNILDISGSNFFTCCGFLYFIGGFFVVDSNTCICSNSRLLYD